MISVGLDIQIFRARTAKAFEADNWYGSEGITEVYYARKFWTLLEQAKFVNINDDCGEFIRLTKANIEEFLQIATHNENYFGGFDGVPALCRILHDFDEDEENGWHYYLNFSY